MKLGAPNACQQRCVNTIEGFECKCDAGFKLNDDGRTCDETCGGILTNTTGEIKSPGWPKNYPLSKKCTWQIVAPNEYKITLTFTEFELEGNEMCKYDWLQVYSGMTETGKDMGKFCGNRIIPEPITSEENLMRVQFHSDGNIQKQGFHANYAFDVDECANNNGQCMHKCINTVGSFKCTCNEGFTLQEDGKKCKEASCGKELKVKLTNRYTDLTSRGWPKAYSPREDCTWILQTEPGHRIGVQVLEIDIESDVRCGYDWLSFWDGRYEANKNTISTSASSRSIYSNKISPVQMTRFCGSKIPEPDWIKSTNNILSMRFHSDGSIVKRGFRVRYHAICGADMVASSQYQDLYSHANYGDSYEGGMECEWLITVPDVRRVSQAKGVGHFWTQILEMTLVYCSRILIF